MRKVRRLASLAPRSISLTAMTSPLSLALKTRPLQGREQQDGRGRMGRQAGVHALSAGTGHLLFEFQQQQNVNPLAFRCLLIK